MTDAADLLLDLKDIHEPLAPATSSAFLLILFVLLGGLMLLGVIGYFLYRRKSLNRQLQQELVLIRDYKHDRALPQLATLLRRVMHHIHGDAINQLQNEQWLNSLDSTFSTNYFSAGRGSVFGEALYRPYDASAPGAQPDTQLLCSDLHKLIGRTKLSPTKGHLV